MLKQLFEKYLEYWQAFLPRQGTVQIAIAEEPLPDHDYHLPLISVPAALETRLDNIPANTPYLQADPLKAAQWQSRLPGHSKPKIGLIGSGNSQFAIDHKRSLWFAQVLPLLDRLDADWFSIQKDIRASDEAASSGANITPLGAEFGDFSDAATLSHMDLVITSCTSLAHLVGVLGKPAWVMLPYSADWRWFNERTPVPANIAGRLDWRHHANRPSTANAIGPLFCLSHFPVWQTKHVGETPHPTAHQVAAPANGTSPKIKTG